MDKANSQPLGDKGGLRCHDLVQQVEGRFGLWEMAFDSVVGKGLKRLFIATRGKKLERAHADMTGRNAGYNGAGKAFFALNALARGYRGQSPRSRDAKRVHGL